MVLYTVLNVIMALLVIGAVGYLAFRFYCWRQGDERIVMLVEQRTPFIVEDMSFSQVTLSCDIPFKNQGKQNGTIMDLFPRHLLPQEQFDLVDVRSWTTPARKERHDGYWEAVIIPPNKRGMVRLRVILTAANGNIRVAVADFPDMNIDIIYQVVGRTDWHYSKQRLTLTAEELQQAMRQ